MPIAVLCPECKAKYNIADTMSGKRVKCRKCAHIIAIPVTAGDAEPGEAIAPIPVRKSTADPRAASKSGSVVGGVVKGAAAPAPAASRAAAKPAVAPPFNPNAVVVEREDEDGNIQPILPAVTLPREPSVPFEFPQAVQLEKILPFTLLGIGFLWLISGSMSRVEGHPALPALRILIYLALYCAVVWPLSFVGLKLAMAKLRLAPPPDAAWRSFAGFCLPYTLACAFGKMSAGVSGLITGVIFGLIIAAGAIGFLFRFRPYHAKAAAQFGAGFYALGIALAVLILVGVNAATLSVFQHDGTAQTLDQSPLAAALAWDSTPPEQPRHGGAASALAAANPAETAPSATQPAANAESPVVSSTQPNDPSMQPQVVSREIQPPESEGAIPQAPVRPSSPAAPRPSPETQTPPVSPGTVVTRKPRSIFDSDFKPANPKTDFSSSSHHGGSIISDDPDLASSSPSPLPQASIPETVAVQTPALKPASPVVSRVLPAPGLGRIDGIIDPAVPGDWVAVIRTRTSDSEKMELWRLTPVVEQLGRPVVFRHGSGDEHYVVAPGGDLLAHVASWPKLSAQIWSFNDEKVVHNIELSDAQGTPTMLGFCSDNLLATQYDRSPMSAVDILDLHTGLRVRTANIPRHVDTPGAITITPDGKFAAVAARITSDAKDEAQLQFIDIGGGNRAPRRLAIPSLDKQWPVSPSGIAFSPDGLRTALLFEHSGNALIVGWRQGESKPIYEQIFPGIAFREPDAPDFTGSPIMWLPDGNAWLLYGRSVVDNESGRIIADLGIPQVKYQHIIDRNTVALEVVAPTDPAGSAGHDHLLMVTLNSQKLAALETPPRVPVHARPLSRPATMPSNASPVPEN